MSEIYTNNSFRFYDLVLFMCIFLILLVIGSFLPILFNQFSFIEQLGYINSLKFSQLIQSVLIFIIPSLIFSVLKNEYFLRYYKLNVSPSPKALILITLFCLSSIPIISYIAEMNNNISFGPNYRKFELALRTAEKYAENLSKMFLSSTTFRGLLINIFIMALIPAIGEELFFRGTMQKIFASISRNHHLAILITGLLFGLIHFQFFSLIPRILLGIYLGYLFYWFNSLWVPIIAHFINNFIVVLYSYLVAIGVADADFSLWEKHKIITSLIFLFINFVILLALYKNRLKSVETEK